MQREYWIKSGVSGTAEQLVDISYRYDRDFTDDELEKISKIAEDEHLTQAPVPLLVRDARNRKEGLPYEEMKIDIYRSGALRFGETCDYGEVEVSLTGDDVSVSIMGMDEEGIFSAANKVSKEAFLNGEDSYLEKLIGETLYYGKQHG